MVDLLGWLCRIATELLHFIKHQEFGPQRRKESSQELRAMVREHFQQQQPRE